MKISTKTIKNQGKNKTALKLKSLSIFSFTERGHALSRKIAKINKNAKLIGPLEIKKGGLRREVKKIFDEKKGARDTNRGIVFIGATGIAIRLIAPYLKDKTLDPAVVVIDERARYAISLLSGHLGKANALASMIAKETGAREVISTATDLAGLPCIEDISLKFSLVIEDKKKIKDINSAILRGEKITVIDSNLKRLRNMKADKFLNKAFVFKCRVAKRPQGPVVIVSFVELPKTFKRWKEVLYLRPSEFVVGIGCRRGATFKEIREAFHTTLTKNNISPLSVRNLSSIDIKSDEKGLIGFAKREGLEIDFITTRRIKNIHPPSGASKTVERLVGVAGVAEPSALISAGTKKKKARIWVKKEKFKRVTIAVARAPYTS